MNNKIIAPKVEIMMEPSKSVEEVVEKPRCGAKKLPIKLPMIPITILATRPKSLPCLILPAKNPAIKPTRIVYKSDMKF